MFKLNQVVILCGGFGTRISNISKGVPKPLITIKKKPFIEILINNLSRYNFKKILLLCHYKGNLFYKKYHNKKINGIKIQCVIEKRALGTLKSLLNSKNKLEKFFLLANGDTYFDIDYNDFVKKFKFKKNIMLIAGAKIKTNSFNRFQNLGIKKKMLKKVYYSKNKIQIINSGICIVNKNSLKYTEKYETSFDKDLIRKLIIKERIQIETYNNNFIDIGTPKDLSYFKKNFYKFKKY